MAILAKIGEQKSKKIIILNNHPAGNVTSEYNETSIFYKKKLLLEMGAVKKVKRSEEKIMLSCLRTNWLTGLLFFGMNFFFK